MNSEIKFTVLIPVYAKEKAENFRLALDSILNQTLFPNEILIIEDGKLGDDLEEIVENVEKQYSNIVRVIRLERNIGIGKVRALGVEECKYEWIAFMDSDDISLPDRFEKQIAYIKQHSDIDMLGGQVTEFDTTPENIISKRIMPLEHNEIYEFAKFRNPMNNVSIMFKKSLALKIGNYKIDYGFEDYEFIVRYLFNGYKVENIPDIIVNVRSGQWMMNRRQGLEYFFKYEYVCMKAFWDMGFINYWEFLRNVLLKFPLRVIPNWMRNLIYKKVLREKVNE